MEIPEFLKELIIKQYGEELSQKIFEGYLEEKFVTLRINRIKTNKQKILEKLEENKIEYCEIEYYEDGLIIKNVKEDEIKKLDIYENGEIYLQSLSSMIPPIILEPKEDENILDMAAAPGGKTTQIAAISNNTCFITACEKNKIRCDRLKYNLNKQGCNRVNVMTEDARKLDDFFSFDKILLDSPCSGSGTDGIFSNKFTKELIERSTKTQKELLLKAIKILKKGGEMVYSTCSILSNENEEIINNILSKGNVEIVPIQEIKGIPQLPTKIKGTICVMPTKLYEGFFVAKLKKIK